MAMSAGTIDVSMPKAMAALTLRVRFARIAGARLRVAMTLMRLAGCAAGMGDVEIEVESAADRERALIERERLQRNFERAEAALMGGRWARHDADRLIQIINQGAATVASAIRPAR